MHRVSSSSRSLLEPSQEVTAVAITVPNGSNGRWKGPLTQHIAAAKIYLVQHPASHSVQPDASRKPIKQIIILLPLLHLINASRCLFTWIPDFSVTCHMVVRGCSGHDRYEAGVAQMHKRRFLLSSLKCRYGKQRHNRGPNLQPSHRGSQ